MTITDGGPNSVCGWCLSEYVPARYGQMYCSYVCGYSAMNHRRAVLALAAKPKRECARCGSVLDPSMRANAIYCSKTCKSMDHTAKYRSKTRLSGVARRQAIINRDGCRCYMCDQVLSRAAIHLDHLLPVSLGGSSRETNVAVACGRCHRSRGNKVSAAQVRKLVELRGAM